MIEICKSSVTSYLDTNNLGQSVNIRPTDLLNRIFSTKYSGGNHTVKCIFHDDRTPSLSVNFDTGAFECKSCNKHGTDITDIYMTHLSINFNQARSELRHQNIILTPRKGDMPVISLKKPASHGTTKKEIHGKKNNPPPPRVNPSIEMIKKLFPQQISAGYKLESLQSYHELDGSIAFWRPRFIHADGSKKIMPLSYENGEWKIKEPLFDGLKPLYNLHLLNEFPQRQKVYITEGEHCADLFVRRNYLGMTSGGATSAKGADWSTLKDRVVVIIPDNDPQGLKFAEDVAEAVKPYVSGLGVLDISQLGLVSGKDIADWLEKSEDNTIEILDSMIEIKPVVNTDIQEEINHNEKSANDKYTHYFGQFYRFNESIYVKDKQKNIFTEICDFIEIPAFTRSSESTDYGAVAKFKGKSKTLIELHFEFKHIHAGTDLIERFSEAGLYINPAKPTAFKQYIAAASKRQTKCLRRALKTGWFGEGHTNFVLPTEIIGPADDIIFQPKEQPSLLKAVKQSGSLQDWKDKIGSQLQGNHYMTSFLGLALSSLLLDVAKMENRGFNLGGSSGSGKTTVVQVAATLFGDGTQPGQGVDHIYMQQWNSTANSMELLTSQYNDLPMIIDELGMLDDKDFGKTIYRMCSGSIKNRLTPSAKLKEGRTWRNIILMSAEIPIADKVSEDGKPPKAGQLVRFVDIAVTKEKMVMALHGFTDAKSFIEALKINCGKYYGTAGPEFTRRFAADDAIDIPALRKTAEDELVEANPGISSEHRRVFRHFALAVVALHLAYKYDVLDSDLSESMFVVAKDYIATSGSLNDAHRSADFLKDTLRSNISQFDNLETKYTVPGGRERWGFIIGEAPPLKSNDEYKLQNLEGYKLGTVISDDPIDERYFVMDKLAITKILGSFPFQETMEHLKTLGFLNIAKARPNGLTGKPRRCGGLPPARYYEISFNFLAK